MRQQQQEINDSERKRESVFVTDKKVNREKSRQRERERERETGARKRDQDRQGDW